MEVEVYIQEKTQHYKGLIHDTKEEIIAINSDETVIFSNGMKAVFHVDIWYSYRGEYFTKFSNFSITTKNNKKVQHELFKRSLFRLIERVFFDVSVFDKFEYILKKTNKLQHDVSPLVDSDPVFYNPDYYIKERTEYYKEFVIDIIWGERTYIDFTKETVIFNNGMKVTFPFEVHVGYCGYSIEYTVWYSTMCITLNDKEIHDENVRNSVKKIIGLVYFDSFISEVLCMVGTHLK
jgi:hypothetical protein